MRRSVVRLIAAREVRDQLRDRRTLFLILGLPALMYPLFVGVGLLFASALKDKKLVVGVVGLDALPKPRPDVVPVAGGPAAAAEARAFPPLVVDGKFAKKYLPDEDDTSGTLIVRPLDAEDEELLNSRKVDALVVVDPDLTGKLERGERPVVRVLGREGEENSKLAVRGVTAVLRKWVADVRAARFARAGLPPDFDSPVEVRDPQTDKPARKQQLDELRDALVKVIPFLLVMWMLTGAIYPAVDMTAGEKERGTMETLLISPAERSEIVGGKFLAVTVLGFGTALWNVLLMVVAVVVAQLLLGHPLLSLGGLAASVLAAL